MSSAQDEYPVRKREKHVELFADEYNGDALLLLLVEQIVNYVRGVYIKTSDRVCGHKDRRRRSEFPADEHLLDVAAGKRSHGGGNRRSHDSELVADTLRELLRRFLVGQRRRAAVIILEQHVIDHAHSADESHAETVFGNEGERYAHFAYLFGGFADERFRLPRRMGIRYFGSRLDVLESRYRFEKLLLSAAGDAGYAEYLARIRLEGNVFQHFDIVGVFAGKP